jgi:histone demethylase JARID1
VFKNLYGGPGEKGLINLDYIEKDFWDTCKDNINTGMKTKYAADIPYKKFFNRKELLNLKKEIADNNTWTLANVIEQKNSLFQFIKNDEQSHICGLTVPWLYFGMLFSTFCWHVEDLFLYSLNYMHQGAAKIWYGIPEDEKEKMDNYIRKKHSQLLDKDPSFIHRLVLLIDPLELIENGINVYKLVQRPGEMVVTFPKGYHCGFSTGFNISEAVNFAVIYF